MRRVTTVLVLIGFAALLGAEASAQVTFTVNSTVDAVDATPGDGACASAAGQCTLRAAIDEINSLQSTSAVIQVPAGTYQGGEDIIAGNVSIKGAGRTRTIVIGGFSSPPPSQFDGRRLEIADLRITGGGLSIGVSHFMSINLHDCLIDHGGITFLGGLWQGDLRIERCQLTNGAGIQAPSAGAGISIIDSVVSFNSGLWAEEMTLLVSNSTFIGNGDAVECFDCLVSIVNSTFSGNGTAIYISNPSFVGESLSITNSTIVDNTDGGVSHDYLRYSGPDPMPDTIANTIVAGNGGFDCFSPTSGDPLGDMHLRSLGHNVIGDATNCGFVAAPSDLVGTTANPVDPLLAPLADYGGPTPTHALLSNSPAINAIPVADCVYDDDGNPNTPGVPLTTDQRGVHRPQGAACDIGAYEFAPACNDGIDNDGDGLVDFPADPGCSSATDDSEHSPLSPCDDGIDNDGDGFIDYRVDGTGDPGCFNPTASSIENPACQDGKDNDGDGKIDFDGGASANHGVPLGPRDPECSTTPYRTYETVTPPCGLGAELVLVLPVLMHLQRRRSNRI
jgi:CSLREA domain-containing protein